MKYTMLGNSDLRVSRICMGCMGFGDPHNGQHSWTLDEAHSRAILRQGLEIARNFGFTKILAVCDEDNFPSEKVILKNGGVLENTRYDAEENVNVKRYWIAL